MKIALQISTSNLGDIVIEQMEDKTTTNKADQQAILVELIFSVLRKVQAVYEIPVEMLDLGDYTSADERFQEERKTPKSSSADKNRQRHFTINHPEPEPEPDPPLEDDDDEYITEQELELLAMIRQLTNNNEKEN